LIWSVDSSNNDGWQSAWKHASLIAIFLRLPFIAFSPLFRIGLTNRLPSCLIREVSMMDTAKLFNRDYSFVVAGQVVSLLGSAVLRFALDLYVLDLTGSPGIFGLMLALSTIPTVLFTPLGGSIADRFNRRNLMVIFDFGSGLVVLALLFFLRGGLGTVPVIGIALALLTIISSMYQPTVQSSTPFLASDKNLDNANGIVAGVGALSGMLGPVLGGLLYSLIGLQPLITASAIAFILSAILEMFIWIPFSKQPTNKGMAATIAGDMLTGGRYMLKENPLIAKVLVLAAGINFIMVPVFLVGLPFILRIILNSSERQYGLGMGIMEFSTLLGAVLAGTLTKKLSIPALYRPIFLCGLFLLPMALALHPALGFWQAFSILLGFTALISITATAISIFVITAIQKQTPTELQGKIMGIIIAISSSIAPLGVAIYGLLFETFSNSSHIPILIASLLVFALGLLSRHILKNH